VGWWRNHGNGVECCVKDTLDSHTEAMFLISN
jgi:hypothetical protein